MYFLPCITSAVGGFFSETVKSLIVLLARKLSNRQGISTQEAQNRIMLRLQTAVLKEIATNGMSFLQRRGIPLPKVVELKDREQMKQRVGMSEKK
jgi:hypothetical protein